MTKSYLPAVVASAGVLGCLACFALVPKGASIVVVKNGAWMGHPLKPILGSSCLVIGLLAAAGIFAILKLRKQ